MKRFGLSVKSRRPVPKRRKSLRPLPVSAELSAALTVVSGGTPKFTAKLILPERFGYHQLATVYAEYANTGDAPMEAPILMLRPTQKGKAGAILTLDKTRLSAGFWTSVMPEGFANEVQFLASGEIPGLLQPGESRRVAIYYAGWQQPWDISYPPFDWGIGSPLGRQHHNGELGLQ